jgi:hypothetical protein
MKPVPRSVNLALAGLFKHPLSHVCSGRCCVGDAALRGGVTLDLAINSIKRQVESTSS